MKPIKQIAPGVLRYGALHFDTVENVADIVARDMASCEIGVDDIKHNKILVDFVGEGQCEIVVKPLVDYLKSVPAKDILVMFSTCVDTGQLDYPAVSMPNSMMRHLNWLEKILSVEYDDTIDRKFLCLMRRPSVSRAMIAKLLLDSGCNIRMSFGSMIATGHNVYRDILPGVELPLLIDGVVDRATNDVEHDQTNPVFHSCLFNLVVETSSQTDANSWHSQFITEKTFKAFALRQIPMWFAVPGLVAEIRKLGFDMFDDVVDHSYDSIANEQERFRAVAQQIQALDQQLSLEQCQQLRKDLVNRLNQNFDLLKTQSEQVAALYHNTIKKYCAI